MALIHITFKVYSALVLPAIQEYALRAPAKIEENCALPELDGQDVEASSRKDMSLLFLQRIIN
jgi:hypothetical protein